MTAELLYVSWGGTGRAASVREAMRRAMVTERPLRYLAVLDDEHFADLDESMIRLVGDELQWLLDAQLELTKTQIGGDELAVAVDVIAGRVADVVADAVGEGSEVDILIGAPIAVAGHDSVESLIEQIATRTGCRVELVQPDAG